MTKRKIIAVSADGPRFRVVCEPELTLRFDMRVRADNYAFADLLLACKMTRAETLDDLIGREFDDGEPEPKPAKSATYRIAMRPGPDTVERLYGRGSPMGTTWGFITVIS